MYCSQRLGGHSQQDIADHFSLAHRGSVSSTIRAVGIDLQDGGIKKRMAQIEKGLNVIKLTSLAFESTFKMCRKFDPVIR